MTRETDEVAQEFVQLRFSQKTQKKTCIFCFFAKKYKINSFLCVFPEKIRNNSFFCVFPAKKQFFPPKSTLRRSFVVAMKI